MRMMQRIACGWLLAVAVWAQERSPADLLKLPVAPGQRIAYGTDQLQFGELRVPAGQGPHPVVVVVHGGCWVAKLGNLDERAVALDLVRPLAASLTEAGIATWNLEYRRLGKAGGGWAGGVDLDGPADLKATLPMQQPVCGSPVITQLLGGTPEEQPQRYREASPVEMLPLGVRQEFFAGRMFAAQAPAYEASAKRAGDAVHASVFNQAGHLVFIDPGSAVWPEVIKSVRTMLGMAQ